MELKRKKESRKDRQIIKKKKSYGDRGVNRSSTQLPVKAAHPGGSRNLYGHACKEKVEVEKSDGALGGGKFSQSPLDQKVRGKK